MNRPNGRGMMPAVKSKRGIVGVLKELFRYSSSLKLPMAVAMLLAVTGAILTIIGPDKLQSDNQSDIGFSFGGYRYGGNRLGGNFLAPPICGKRTLYLY